MTAVVDQASGRFERFCVVGLGNHARTKLIPAILSNGQAVAGVVTTGTGDPALSAPVFGSLTDAIGALPSGTTFVLANPPVAHFPQAMALIEAGRDLFVEKPAFVTRQEAETVAAACEASGVVMVEAFMHRHTDLYRRLRALDPGEIAAIQVCFLIPQMPEGTYRQAGEIAASSLYDMGCYPLSLLSDLGLRLDGIAIGSVVHGGDPMREAIALTGQAGNALVDIRIGVGAPYANSVTVTLVDGRRTTFAPFFYGRAGEKRLTGGAEVELIHDPNAIEKMFAVHRRDWLSNQTSRHRKMTEVTATLQRLGKDLCIHREKARPVAF